MYLRFEETARNEVVLRVAEQMMVAARTAPKARGVDNLVISLISGDEVIRVSNTMKEMAEVKGAPDFFRRDAENVLVSSDIVVIGTKKGPLGLNPCGMCGFADCKQKEKHTNHPCVFNCCDLGIAIGSAVSVAADHRVDNRVMYTVGQAILRMGILENYVKIIFGIPLCVSSKNPFFDRK